MEALSCRLLPYTEADGATNMAADELLVRTAAAADMPALRCYGWAPPTLSLGYFQPATVRLTEPLLGPLPWVRRPSGGATLVHHHELTYALAVPPGPAWRSAEPWMVRLHRLIARALADLGLVGQLVPMTGAPTKHGDVLCFQQHTPGDLLCRGHKVVGSAQRKYHQALLQHGSILLAQSEHTPALAGLRELTGVSLTTGQVEAALARTFATDTGWRLEPGSWAPVEAQAIAALAREKYANMLWNDRR